jgi:hypothetical protein
MSEPVSLEAKSLQAEKTKRKFSLRLAFFARENRREARRTAPLWYFIPVYTRAHAREVSERVCAARWRSGATAGNVIQFGLGPLTAEARGEPALT